MSGEVSILVVDCDHAFRESIVNLLLVCGIKKFEVAISAEEALQKIAAVKFDIILIDLFMPYMTGLQLAQEFRQRMPNTEIILLVKDQQQAVLNRSGHAKLNFPSILKSSVSRTLPLLLSEESHSRAL